MKCKCTICEKEFDSNKSMTNHRRHHDPLFKEKYSIAMKGKNKGENNGLWKGDNVGYGALHDYIKYNKPKPDNCEDCNRSKKLDLANISGKYTRNLEDWKWLCRSCHMKYDYKQGIRTTKGGN